MADGRIEVNDIFAPNVDDAIKAVTGEMNKLTDALTAALNVSKNYKATTDTLTGSETKLLKIEQESEKLRQATIKTEQELLKLRKLKEAQAKKEEQAAEGLTNEWKKQTVELNKLQKEAKEAALKYGVLSKEFKEVQGRAVTLKIKLDDINRSLGNSTQDVGKYERAMGGLKGALKDSVATMIGWTAAIGIAFQGIKIAIGNAIEFDKALKSLSAITGLTGKDLSFMASKAKEFSSVTLQSATKVLIAFEKVGSLQPILLKNKEALAEVTKQAIILSEASGGKLGLEESAIALSSAMNQFSLDATEAGRVINVISAAEVAGSATTRDFSESLKNVGTVAKTSNMSIEQTAAAIEVLAKFQLVGAEAGTKLRGVISKLKDAGYGYESGIFNITDALAGANKAMAQKTTAQEKDNFISKLFMEENKTAGLILLQNTETFEELTNQITGTTSALDQQRIQNESAGAEWAKLSNIFANAFTSESFSNILAGVAVFFRGLTMEITGSLQMMAAPIKAWYSLVVDAFRFDKISKGTYLQGFKDTWIKFTKEMGNAWENISNPLGTTENQVLSWVEKAEMKIKLLKEANKQAMESRQNTNKETIKSDKELLEEQKKNLLDIAAHLKAHILDTGGNVRKSYEDRKKLIQNQFEQEILGLEKTSGAYALADAQRKDSLKELETELEKYLEFQGKALTSIQTQKVEIKAFHEVQLAGANDINKSLELRIKLIDLAYDNEIKAAKGNTEAISAANDKKTKAYENLSKQQALFESDSYKERVDKINNFYDVQKELAGNDVIEQKKIEENRTKDIQSEYSKRLQSHAEMLGEMNDMAQQAFDIGGQFLENQKIQEQQNLDSKLQAIDIETQKKLEAAGLLDATKQMQIESDIAELEAKLATETDLEARANLQKSISEKKKELAKTKIIEDAEKEKIKIQQISAIKIAEINRKQAILEKLSALANIGINTAVAAMKAAGQTGIFAAIAVPVILALGAAQAAVVVAKPLPEIPKFKKGGTHNEGGFAMVGDGGKHERITLPDGSQFLSPDSPTILNLPKHTKIDSGEVTERLLHQAINNIQLSGNKPTESLILHEISGKLDKLKQVHVNIDKRGFETFTKQAANRTSYLNNKIRF
jgi:TP901 family phage tail tape measure protein